MVQEALRFRESVNSHIVFGYYKGPGDESVRGIRVAEIFGNYAREAAVIYYPGGNATAYFMRYKIKSRIGFPAVDLKWSRREVIPVISEDDALEMNLRIARSADSGYLSVEELVREWDRTKEMYEIAPDPESVASEIFRQFLNSLSSETVAVTQSRIPSIFTY